MRFSWSGQTGPGNGRRQAPNAIPTKAQAEAASATDRSQKAARDVFKLSPIVTSAWAQGHVVVERCTAAVGCDVMVAHLGLVRGSVVVG